MRAILFACLSSASAGLLRVAVNNSDIGNSLSVPGTTSYGSSKCPCVGFNNVGGKTVLEMGGQKVDYPADVGARCEAWDETRAPQCKGANPPDWCAQQWCYVDPCNCDLPEIPKISGALPDAEYQGKPLYYSFETCGGSDSYTSGTNKEACVNKKTEPDCSASKKCQWNGEENKCGGAAVMGYCMKPLSVNKWGENDCRCIGIDNIDGSTTVKVGNPEVDMDYPADVGASCDQWDLNRHPECTGDEKAPFCYDRWCFVDPCKCDLDVPPVGSNHLYGADFQGKQIFLSYRTCGSENRYSDTHRKHALKKQDEVCATFRSSAWAVTPVVALVMSFIVVA